MTYEEFQAYTARYGFIDCPLSREQFDEALELGAREGDFWGIACDVSGGVDFHAAVNINTRRSVWSGSPCPEDPDNFWIDDATGERIPADQQ